jgi:hypothetical protein
MPATERLEIPIVRAKVKAHGPKQRKSSFESLSRWKDCFSNEEFIAMVATFADLCKEGKLGAVDLIPRDVFSEQTPVFLRILRESDTITMNRQRFVEEVGALAELKNPKDLFSGSYIYSITTTNPEKVQEVFSQTIWSSLPLDRQAQVQVGYLHHEFLYSLNSVQLREFLNRFVERANEVVLSLKPNPHDVSKMIKIKLT